jgi:hypothetical protein
MLLAKAIRASGIRLPSGEGLATSAAFDFSQSASVALPGPRGRTSSAGGLQFAGAFSASAAEAVRGRSPKASSTDCATTTTKESIS